MKKREMPKHKVKKWVLYIGLGAGLITLFVPPVAVVWRIACWKTSIENDINHLESWKTSIDKRMNSMQKDINDIKSRITEETKDIEGLKDDKGRLRTVVGMIGLIDEKLAQRAVSKYGVGYFLDYNICEVNEAFDKWDKIGRVPYLGDFIEVENTYNNLKIWCMVVGSFSDTDHPNRILLVSKEAANSLVFKKSKGTLPVKIRLLSKNVWKANKECVYLYKSVYMLENHE